MITVHGVPLSPFVRKVQMALRYKGLDFTSIPVMPGDDSEAFSKISPLHKVPVLEHDGFTTPDSSVILRYLDQTFPDKPIYPSNRQSQAKACWLEEYGDTKLVESAAPIFFQRIVRPRIFNEPTDEALVTQKIDVELPPVLRYLDNALPADGYAVGDHLTIADIGIISPLMSARHGEYVPDAKTYPKLAAYFERAIASDMVQKQLSVEMEFLGAG